LENKRLLLDSHAFLWAIAEPELLGSEVRRLLDDPETEAWISVASIWELLLKHAKGKLQIKVEIPELMSHLRKARLKVLTIRYEHVMASYRLPGVHKEPFDRLLIGQAQIEDLVLATKDSTVRRYGLVSIWN
jgi:PIN domain nuclease of toxin-antitoxin system